MNGRESIAKSHRYCSHQRKKNPPETHILPFLTGHSAPLSSYGTTLCMWSDIDQNVLMRHITVCMSEASGKEVIGIMWGWWWSDLRVDDDSPVADALSTSTSAHPENGGIPPKFYSRSSPRTLHTFPGWFNLIPSLKPCALLGWFVNLCHWFWPLCRTPEQCTQVLLGNPSGSTTDTAHSTCINWTYHPPPTKRKILLLLANGISMTQFPKPVIWESTIIPLLPDPHIQ